MATKDRAYKPEEEKRLLKPALAILQSLRIRQWVKNSLVFLPFLFAVNQVWAPGNLAAVPQTLLHLLGVFLGFCALSSALTGVFGPAASSRCIDGAQSPPRPDAFLPALDADQMRSLKSDEKWDLRVESLIWRT